MYVCVWLHRFLLNENAWQQKYIDDARKQSCSCKNLTSFQINYKCVFFFFILFVYYDWILILIPGHCTVHIRKIAIVKKKYTKNLKKQLAIEINTKAQNVQYDMIKGFCFVDLMAWFFENKKSPIHIVPRNHNELHLHPWKKCTNATILLHLHSRSYDILIFWRVNFLVTKIR